MPEYLAPGVYVEEVSFRAKSIEGVSTTTTGLVGPARYGPLDIEPEIVTSLVEFERVYGGKERLIWNGAPTDNYLWHGARAFFEEGGKRLYVSRIFRQSGLSTGYAAPAGGETPPVTVAARFPGRAGDARVTFTFRLGQNVLADTPDGPALRSTIDRDIVHIGGAIDAYHLALWDEAARTWRFNDVDDDLDAATLDLADLDPATTTVRTLTVTVTVEPTGRDMPIFVAADLALDPHHRRGGAPDSVFAYFAAQPASLSRSRTIPIVISTLATHGLSILQDFIDAYVVASPVTSPPDLGLEGNLLDDESGSARRSLVVSLRGGSDGDRPLASHYEGEVNTTTDRKTGLKQFEDIEDISIVAAPGSTAVPGSQTQAILSQLIIHAERMRYRIAVLDSVKDQTISEVREMRALFDSSHAALYYPWVRVIDPLSQEEINVPPSGHVAGIYARNDIERAVYKAPANEVVNLAIGFEKLLNKAQQEVLNPEGINCFRFFEGRGMRLWGARTISSDPEWKYVNLRRYFAYLERSIDKGTQWAVFEPNGPQLWANVRRTLEDFLLNEWQNGALLGDKPDRSFFVKCDRSTMTQNDLDNGRLVCLIGVAPLRPAEFVIFRIGQWTADRKV